MLSQERTVKLTDGILKFLPVYIVLFIITLNNICTADVKYIMSNWDNNSTLLNSKISISI